MKKFRLSLLSFFHVFAFGVYVPIISLYLTKYLGLTGTQSGTILSVTGIAALISPIIGSFIADRVISAERTLGLCFFAASLSIYFFSRQVEYYWVLASYFLFLLFMVPTTALANAVVFHHIENPDKDFAKVRVWGTVGWVVAAWLFGYFWLQGGGEKDGMTGKLPDALLLVAITTFLLGLYSFTLSTTKVHKTRKERSLIPLDSIKVVKNFDFALLLALCTLISASFQYYFFGMAPFLKQLGYPEAEVMPLMSSAQILEVAGMAALGGLISRFGQKRMMILGLLCMIYTFSVYISSSSVFVLISGISCMGLSYAFFITTATIFFDNQCDRYSRAGVQQIISLCMYAGGSTIGNYVAGWSMDFFTNEAGIVDYNSYWSIPLGVFIVNLLILVLFFKGKGKKRESIGPEGKVA